MRICHVSVPHQFGEQPSAQQRWTPMGDEGEVRTFEHAALDRLMHEALAVPGAAEALLAAFAAQSRALRLVQEADARGAASLPNELRQRLAQAAERTPTWLAAGAGVRP
jgi:hypothetical protein